MVAVRIFSDGVKVAAYDVDHGGWLGRGSYTPACAQDYIAEAKRKVIYEGCLAPEEAEAATYVIEPSSRVASRV